MAGPLPNIPGSFRGADKSFLFDVVQTIKNVQQDGGSCSPYHGPAKLTMLKAFFVWIIWSFSKTIKVTMASPNTDQLFLRRWRTFASGCYAAISKTFKLMAGQRSPTSPVAAQFILRRWRILSPWCYAELQQRSNERLAVLPQTRSSSFHSAKKFFVWMAWSFLKTFKFMTGPCSHNHGPVHFWMLKNLFVWMFCSHLKTFKLMTGPRSPISPLTAQLISRRWRMFSSGCYADFQQRSKKRLVVFPQTRYNSIHGVQEPFRLDIIQLFKSSQTVGWVVLPQTRPSCNHGVEEAFCLDVTQPFQRHSS